jgi:hypothetical protein
MVAHPDGRALRLPFRPLAGVVAGLLLLLGVHADHRLSRGHVPGGLRADVAELGVPVGVLRALDGAGVALQAEVLPPQQVSDGIRRHRVSLDGQLGRQLARRFRRPPQR